MSNSDWQEYPDEAEGVPEEKFPVSRDRVRDENSSERVDLVRDADEDEWRQNDVHHGVAGNENEDSVRVRGQPDVVLRYK